MIILDDTNASSSFKSIAVDFRGPASASPQVSEISRSTDQYGPPPAYSRYQQQQQQQPLLPTVEGPVGPLRFYVHERESTLRRKKSGMRARARFCDAFAIAIALCLAIYIVLKGTVPTIGIYDPDPLSGDPDDASPVQNNPDGPQSTPPPLTWPSYPEWSTTRDCFFSPSSSNSSASNHTSFSLDISAPEHLITSTGGTAAVSFEIIDSPTRTDEIRVDIIFSNSQINSANDVRICFIRSSRGGQGIGIDIPVDGKTQPISIIIGLPRGGEPSIIQSFKTDLRRASHAFANLDGLISFKMLSIRTSHGYIESKGMYAESLSIESAFAPIRGVYHANFMSLITKDGGIDVITKITGTDMIANLNIETSNGPIDAQIHLDEAGPIWGPSWFEVIARTTKSRMDVSFPSAPYPCRLDLSATTENAPVTVRLHESFEGQYHLSTHHAASDVRELLRPDPSRENRKREHIFISSSSNITSGIVRWGEIVSDEPWQHGSATLTTAMAPVNLLF